MKVLQAEAEPALGAALAVAIETGLRVRGLPGHTVREDATWYTVSKAHRLHSAEPLSADVCNAFRAARLDPRRPFAPESFPRSPGRAESETKGSAEQLLIALLKTRLFSVSLMFDGKFVAAYNWHDLRHAYARRNASRTAWCGCGTGWGIPA